MNAAESSVAEDNDYVVVACFVPKSIVANSFPPELDSALAWADRRARPDPVSVLGRVDRRGRFGQVVVGG